MEFRVQHEYGENLLEVIGDDEGIQVNVCPDGTCDKRITVDGDMTIKAVHHFSGDVLYSTDDKKYEIPRLTLIRQAVHDYHTALRRREHGGVAMSKAFDEIRRILDMPISDGMPW